MLTKTTIQIIKALIELAKLPPEKYEGSESIARKISAPANYLGKLLQQLSSRGVVHSQKGFGGGFRLGKAPGQIPLYDVAQSTENIDEWTNCAFGFGKCSEGSPCLVHSRWKVVCQTHLNFLKETTIKDLLTEENQNQ